MTTKAKPQPEATSGERQALNALIEAISLNTEALDRAFEESEGEVDERTDALERAIAGDLEEAVERLCRWRVGTLGALEAIKAESERLAAAKARNERRVRWAEGLIRDLMTRAETRKLQAGTYSVGLIAGSISVHVPEQLDPALLPEGLRRTKVEVKPDKTAIKAAIKAGGEEAERLHLLGVDLQRGPQRVGIK